MSRPIRSSSRRSVSRPSLESLEFRQLLTIFPVTSTADSGAGTLRAAILAANAASGADTITFAIPGSGVQSIVPLTPLPDVSDPVTIDASTQPGYAGTPLIELNGSSAGFSASGLNLTAGASVVRGLAINRFANSGITTTGDGNAIVGDFIGTDPTGTIALGNRAAGILLDSRNNMVGGAGLLDRDLISGNGGNGLDIMSVSGLPANNRIQGDIIGADVTGTSDLGNAGDGVFIQNSSNLVGGATPSAANIIAFNGAAGVQVGDFDFQSGVTSNTISTNSIFSNAGLGIDLGSPGVSFNHPGGANFGPNNLLNYPTITSAFPSGAQTTVQGTYNGVPDAPVTVQFFSSPTPDPSGFGEGRTFLGSTVITTDNSGDADLSTTLAANVAPGQFLTAAATDGIGDTSEFSRAVVVTATARADLAVSVSSSTSSIQAAQPLTYFITVTNNGPSQATGVVLNNTLPQGATFISALSTQGTTSTSNGVVTASIGTLSFGQSATLTLVATPTITGTAVNTATASADQSDPDSQNNTATTSTTVTPFVPPDLAIFGQAFPNPVALGSDLTYEFVAQNEDFTKTATGVSVTNVIPAGLTFVSARSSQGTVSFVNNTVTVALGSLTPEANATITIVARPTEAGLLTNTADIREDGQDPNSLNNEAVVLTTVNAAPPADLAIQITAAPQPEQVGRGFTYEILVSNFGPALATNVAVSGVLADAATLSSVASSQGTASVIGRALTADLGNLPAGATASITLVLVAGAPGSIETYASVTADQPDFNVANNYASLTSTVVADQAPPTVVEQKLVVSGQKITRVVLTFSQALDPILAADTANYRIYDLGKNSNLPVDKGTLVPIIQAVYDPATRSVTLTPRRPLVVGRFYELVANGPGAPGITDTSGNVLDGDLNGLQDGIYQSLIGRGTHSRPYALQVGVPTPKPPKVVHHPPKQAVTPRTRKTTNINVNITTH